MSQAPIQPTGQNTDRSGSVGDKTSAQPAACQTNVGQPTTGQTRTGQTTGGQASTGLSAAGSSSNAESTLAQKAEKQKAEAAQQLAQGKQEAAKAVDALKHQGQEAIAGVKAQVGQAAEQVRTAAGQGVAQAKSQTVQVLERQKSNAACCVSSIKDALQSASHTLRDEKNEPAAGVVDAAANRLGQLSDYLDRRPLGDLMADAEDLARRRPEVVLGGLFVVGLAAARFLKASSRGPRPMAHQPNVIRHPQAYHTQV